MIRECKTDECNIILDIINKAAHGYMSHVPDSCWDDPYMDSDELEREITSGVRFYAFEEAEQLVGVMGIQEKENITLIRHAYVIPEQQGRGIGNQLLKHLLGLAKSSRVFVGTWALNTGAVRFYEKSGFRRLDHRQSLKLLRQYWNISDDQAEASVVLRLSR